MAIKISEKWCSGCEKMLDRSSFTRRGDGTLVSRCKECRVRQEKAKREADPDSIRKTKARYRERHPERVGDYMKAYRESYKGRRNVLLKRRKQDDPEFKMAYVLRSRFADELRRGKTPKSFSALSLLGCSVEEFRDHISKMFKPGMSWENWGRGKGMWNLDHIRPIASFNLLRPEDQKVCFHFTNFQPLWSEDNLRKHDTWDPEGMCGN